jgi:hypothetical protein
MDQHSRSCQAIGSGANQPHVCTARTRQDGATRVDSVKERSRQVCSVSDQHVPNVLECDLRATKQTHMWSGEEALPADLGICIQEQFQYNDWGHDEIDRIDPRLADLDRASAPRG